MQQVTQRIISEEIFQTVDDEWRKLPSLKDQFDLDGVNSDDMFWSR